LFNPPLTIEQAWRQGAGLLICSDSATLDSQLLLLKALDKDNRAYLLTWPEKILSEGQISQFEYLITQRLEGRPIAHLMGYREFWGLELKVNASTLIPRPDTEIIIDTVLELYQDKLDKPLNALDLGTGTGAIALALKSECPAWQLDAVEYDKAAFELAKLNSSRLNLPVDVYHGSWFEPLPELNSYHLIVSNPPYIDEQDPHLTQGDVRFEPKSALTAENDGLADIEVIVDKSRCYLQQNGYLVIEHGYQQGQSVQAIFQQYPEFTDIQTREDLAGQPRITLARFFR